MMMRKVTALYDSNADAQQAKQRLLEIGVADEHVQILNESASGTPDAGSTVEHKGLWASIKEMFIPDDDRRTFEESIRRGGFLLVASVEADHADDAIEALEGTNAVDLERRQEQWKTEGSAGQEPAPVRSPLATDQASTTEQTIPVVEERLRVGKRQVDQGRVRVRSFVVEEPIHQEVQLREEHVEIERRPVNQPASSSADTAASGLFREQTVELQETAQEAVVAKDAVVTEELRLRKRAAERVESIDDTVRHTEVEVDDSRGATGATRGDSAPPSPERGTRRSP
jgi:uncharacterized protein (TIGR02271 family)